MEQKLVEFEILKTDTEQRRVYGWASIAKTKDGRPVVDLQGDLIEVADLEDAASRFLKEYRQGGEMHSGTAASECIASVVFTPELQKALGVPEQTLPEGWLVGFEVPSELFQKVKAGTRLMFSIEGEADTETVEA